YKLNEGDHIEKGDVILEIELDNEIESVDKDDRTAHLAITRRALLLELSEIRTSILVDMERKKYEEAAAKKREFKSKHELLSKIVENRTSDESAREDYIGKNLVSVYSSLRGVLSFSVDGLEGVANPSNIYTFDFSRLDDVPHKTNVAKAVVAKGEQIYKVIDDSNVLIAVKIPMESRVETFTEADSFVVWIGNTELQGTLHESFTQGDSTICVIRLHASFPSFFTSRILPCTVSPKGYKGLLVPSSALVEIGGVRGVYRVGVTGLAEFVPVKVLKNEA
ncbi:MAG: HlyD family efflux transporter periplasmic adaptor subunit, partial [Bacillota bacterium]|nr:HlyD family efflux transporter periplasmic adaptor subunit [Bacillota bacterium]